MGTMTHYDGKAKDPFTIDVFLTDDGTATGNPLIGNAIMIGPSVPLTSNVKERFMVQSIQTVVPIPATAWLLFSAMGFLGFFSRKKNRSHPCAC